MTGQEGIPVTGVDAPREGAWCCLEGIEKTWPDFRLQADLSLERGSQLALLGPSGAGKSTLLRMIAGLLAPDRGSIRIHGRDVTRLPARQRGVGMVFQDFALFPHLDVGRNIAYGLQVQGIGARERERKVDSLLERFSLQGFARRKVANLSGGERQRVALARAMALEPDLMLFDEPLASLDARLRKDLRDELRGLQRRLGLTSILVTHDQEDALASADRVAVMHRGRVVRTGSPEDLYDNPGTVFVARFIGEGNVLPNLRGLPWYMATEACSRVFLRPEALERGGDRCVRVTVEDAAYQGRYWLARGIPAAVPDAMPDMPRTLAFSLGRRPVPGEVLDLSFSSSSLRPLAD